MVLIENGRAVVKCDRCPVRLDVGLAQAFERRAQMPSMWRSLGDNQHLCPSCARIHGPRFQRTSSGVHLVS